MPQPCPTVSADQASVTSRAAARMAAVLKLPATGSLQRRRSVEILEQHAIEDALARAAAPVSTVRAVKSLPSSAAGPRTTPRIGESSRWWRIRRTSAPADRCGSRPRRGPGRRRRRRRRAAAPAASPGCGRSRGQPGAVRSRRAQRRRHERRPATGAAWRRRSDASRAGWHRSLEPRRHGAELARRRHAAEASRPASPRGRSPRPWLRRPARRSSSGWPRRSSGRSPARTPCRRRQPCATGEIARAKPSSAISASVRRLTLVSLALVATSADGRVLAGARRRRAAAARRCAAACARRPAPCRPRVRTPATTWPVAGSIDVADGVDGDDRGDDQAVGQGDRRPSRARLSSTGPWPILPTVAPAPAPTLPSRDRPVGRRLRGLVAAVGGRPDLPACRRSRGRTGSPPARSARRRGADLPADVALLEIPHDALRGVEAVGAAAGQHDGVDLVDHVQRVSRSVSRVPGAPPRCDTPPTAPSRRPG